MGTVFPSIVQTRKPRCREGEELAESHTARREHQDSCLGASPVAQTVKSLPAMRETWVRSLGWEDPWRRKGQPTPASLPGESHGPRSLVGYSPRGCKESDMTERLTLSPPFLSESLHSHSPPCPFLRGFLVHENEPTKERTGWRM